MMGSSPKRVISIRPYSDKEIKDYDGSILASPGYAVTKEDGILSSSTKSLSEGVFTVCCERFCVSAFASTRCLNFVEQHRV